jgi:hypothetical protein
MSRGQVGVHLDTGAAVYWVFVCKIRQVMLGSSNSFFAKAIFSS